jgi:hypothetical protein
LAGCSAVHSTLSEDLDIALSGFEADYVTLNSDFFRQVVEIVIESIQTVLEICVIWFFLTLGRILIQGSISTKLFAPLKHQVDLRKVEIHIYRLGISDLVADTIPQGMEFVPLHGLHPSFTISFFV